MVGLFYLQFLPQTSLSIEFQRNGATSTCRVSPFILGCSHAETTGMSMFSDSAVTAGDNTVLVPSQWSSYNPVPCGTEVQRFIFSLVHVLPQTRSAINRPCVTLLVHPAPLTCLAVRTFSSSGENCPLTVVNSVSSTFVCKDCSRVLFLGCNLLFFFCLLSFTSRAPFALLTVSNMNGCWQLGPRLLRIEQLASLLLNPHPRTSLASEVPRRLAFSQGKRQIRPDHGTMETISLLQRVNNQLGLISGEVEWRITWNSWRLFQNAFGVNSAYAQAPMESKHIFAPESFESNSEFGPNRDGESRTLCPVLPRNGLHGLKSLTWENPADTIVLGPSPGSLMTENVLPQQVGSHKRALEQSAEENQNGGSSEAEGNLLLQKDPEDLVVSKRLKHEVPIKPVVETLPRFKLRRCPTNKEWGIARDSQGTSIEDQQCSTSLLKQPGAAIEKSTVEVGEAVQPLLASRSEVSRKRPLAHGSDQRSERSSESEATCSSCGAVPGACHHGGEILNGAVSKVNRLWVDGGSSSISEARKRRRKGSSPVSGDDLEGGSGKGRCTDSASPPVYSNHEDRNDVQSEPSFTRAADNDCDRCIGNVLILQEDRECRENGATVELVSTNRNMWMLAATLRGETLLTHKAAQFDATGTSNRYTHAMMFKVKKGIWLEFEDRKQWLLFKHLHEQCYQRNARTVPVRQIPIPGVREVEECPGRAFGEAFVRPPVDYIRQRDFEEDMVAQSNRLFYDMDSEDEEWLLQTNGERTSGRGSRSRPRISEETLERTIDKLEKVSFSEASEITVPDSAVEICHGLGSPEVIKAIHSYWLAKRLRKGMALIRHFQVRFLPQRKFRFALVMMCGAVVSHPLGR